MDELDEAIFAVLMDGKQVASRAHDVHVDPISK
jgi:hypothetical protein